MKKISMFVALLVMLVMVSGVEAKDKFNVCRSPYIGWDTWAYAQESGILKKWADKNGIEISMEKVNDYIESINLYTTGKFDACTMTNMDALAIPAAGGVDSTALIVGDFSDGNDGIVTKKENSIKELKGKKIKGVQFSVSNFLLDRGLELNGMSEKDVTMINVSDADIISLFESDPNSIVVAWNPQLMKIRNQKGAKLIFDSSKIPGEIIDLMVVKTKAPDSLKKALVGAWYETMSIMSGKGKVTDDAIGLMAKESGGTVAEFKSQLTTTAMFYEPSKAVAFAESPELKKTMDYVRKFSFNHGLYGDGAKNADLVGIQFPDGSILGNPKNVKLRIDSRFMKEAIKK
jgi:NitT/TauT family transport system substrate-binding protein